MKAIVAICDDEQVYIEEIKKYIKNYYQDREYELHVYNDPCKLLMNCSQISVLFLDVEMPGMTGIEVLRKLEGMRFKGKVIFITNHDDITRQGYGCNVHAYIKKDQLDNIEKELQRLDYILQTDKHITIGSDVINVDDIIYIEGNSGCNVIYTVNAKYTTTVLLHELLNRIDVSYFMLVHRSYIVNFRYIHRYSPSKIELYNKVVIKISRKYQDNFKSNYLDYLEWC